MKLLRSLQNSFRRSGFLGTIDTCARALVFYAKEQTPSRRRSRQREHQRESEFDKRFGVKTEGTINLADVAVLPTPSRLFGLRYSATSSAIFQELLSCVQEDLKDFVFIDFGSGLGKVLLLASEYPFRAIRGVEFSTDLHGRALHNIRSYRSPTQKCTDLISICPDAAEYRIPEEPAIFYFYNPFLEPVMMPVMQNIEQSLQRNPRKAYLVYYNPKARNAIDKSRMFRLIAEGSTYCVYRSAMDAVPSGKAIQTVPETYTAAADRKTTK